MDTAVVTDISTKLDSSKISDKTLNGNFATLKVMDTAVVTDISTKLDKTGGTISSDLGVSGLLTATGGLTIGGTNNITLGDGAVAPTTGQLGNVSTINLSGAVLTGSYNSLGTINGLKGVWLYIVNVNFSNTLVQLLAQ
jgi:hypothetical protein